MISSVTHARQVRRYAQKVKPHPCYLCSSDIKYDSPLISTFIFKRQTFSICGKCRGRYWAALEQAALFGKRYRFIEKGEIPKLKAFGIKVGYKTSRIAQHRVYTRLYAALLLLKERQKNQHKEVDWMIDDMTKKLLKLPDRIATAVGKTYAVRGDDYQLSDDEVLVKIKEILESIDPLIIDRNKNKRVRPIEY